jgi:hypothetical protein
MLSLSAHLFSHWSIPLKVDGNEKFGGSGKTVIQLLSGIVAIECYLQFERVLFVLKFYFHFRLLQLYK